MFSQTFLKWTLVIFNSLSIDSMVLLTIQRIRSILSEHNISIESILPLQVSFSDQHSDPYKNMEKISIQTRREVITEILRDTKLRNKYFFSVVRQYKQIVHFPNFCKERRFYMFINSKLQGWAVKCALYLRYLSINKTVLHQTLL